MSHRSLLRLVPLLAVGAALACGPGSEQEPAPGAPAQSPSAAPAAPAATPGAISEAARAEARQIFETRCVTCHGAQGKGDGPASAGLVPKPRDFTDPTWQRSVTDQHVEQILQYGGAAVGKSAAMPANPDLTGKPEVVTALREYVRGLAP
jgi:mono/diheme cytochrome c family protein